MLTNEMYIKLKVITNVCTHHPNWSFIIYKKRLWKQALEFLAQEQVIHCPRTGSDEGGGGGGESPTVDQEAKLRKLCLNRSSRAGRWEPVLIVEDTGSYLACNIEAMAVWVKKTKTTEKLKSRRRLTCGSVRELSCTPSKWVSNGCARYFDRYFARHCARYCAAPEVAHVWFAILTSIENNNNNSNNKNNDNKKELKRQ